MKCPLCDLKLHEDEERKGCFHHQGTSKCPFEFMSVGGKWWRKLGRMIKAKTRETETDKDVFVAGMEFGYRHGTGENVVKQCWDRYKGLESEGKKV